MSSHVHRIAMISSHLVPQKAGTLPSEFFPGEVIDESIFLSERNGNGVVITLNRPKSLNALNCALFVSLKKEFEKWESDEGVQVIVLRGNGKSYCAGGDIKELSSKTQQHGEGFPKFFFTREYNLDYFTSTLKTPQVTFWDGISMGGGLGISSHGPFRICTQNTVWAMPEIKIGLFPDVGGSYFLSRLPFPLGIFIGLTGERLGPGDLMHFSIATHFVPSERLNSLQDTLLSYQDKSIDKNTIKEIIEKFSQKAPSSELAAHFPVIQRTFCFHTVEEIIAALEKEDDPWSKKILQQLQTLCPVSLKVILQQIIRGKLLPIEDCFRMEYRIALRILAQENFHIGVESILGSKKKPVWQPQHLHDVSNEMVQRHFEPLKEELLFDERK
eukprot:TRINITY_DN2171_c0_g1_i1.p1 TRINITY_DN2171_c0_g1~~TRINITY_DN2171_c0_g1_i1.p1  ORF type:complete len:386 (+),score=76.28 TRINITY_DN2171_c0_g1_i1:339-1496(+)